MRVQYAHTRVFGCPLVEADEYGLTIINESFCFQKAGPTLMRSGSWRALFYAICLWFPLYNLRERSPALGQVVSFAGEISCFALRYAPCFPVGSRLFC